MNSTLDLNESLTNEDEENEEDDQWPPPAPSLHRTSDMSQTGMVLNSIQTPLASTTGQLLTSAPIVSVPTVSGGTSSGAKSKRQLDKSGKSKTAKKQKQAKYSKKLATENELTGLSGWTSDEDDGEAEHSIWTEDGLHRFNL